MVFGVADQMWDFERFVSKKYEILKKDTGVLCFTVPVGESVRRMYYRLLGVHYVRTASWIALDVYTTCFMCT